METLAAISLVGSIIQFIDAGGKLVTAAKEIRQSTSGMTEKDHSMQETAQRLRDLSSRIGSFSSAPLTPDQSDLRMLAHDCGKLSEQMLSLISTSTPMNGKSYLRSLRSAYQSHRYRQPRKELEQKLLECHAQLQFQYNKVIR